MRDRLLLIPLSSLVVALPAHATIYLTVEQAQALMFPQAPLMADFKTLSDAQIQAIERDSGVKVATRELQAWRAADGGWFILDQVYGKHSPIRYALALAADGSVRQVEILEYLESYGGEVRLPAWRKQFVHKRHGDEIAIDRSIRNISGATLSCEHVTDGIRRVLSTYALVLSADGHG